MKRYQMGGPTSYAESGSAGGSEMSFSEAFKAARAVAKREGRDPDKEQFTWKGKKYKAEMAKDTSTPSRVTKTETTTEVETPVRKSGGRGSKPGSTSVTSSRSVPRAFEGARQLRDFLRRDVEEKSERNRGAADRFANFVRSTRMVGGAPSYMKDESGRIRTPSNDTEEMRRGGRVKKYAKGGSVGSASRRADGIASKGKTRGRMI